MKMRSIYVLSCENNKYYIGKTEKFLSRITDHFKNNGSEWTKLYKPIRVLEVKDNADEFEKDRYTKIYMKKYGIENVRGGSYSQVVLPFYKVQALQDEICTLEDLCFKCNDTGHFARDCLVGKNIIWYCEYCNKEFNNQEKAYIHEEKCRIFCLKCEKNGHYEKNCLVKDKLNCYKCGRNGHFESECFAKTNIQGNTIYNTVWGCEQCNKQFLNKTDCIKHEKTCKKITNNITNNTCYKCGKWTLCVKMFCKNPY
jgi:predicted GIY-YIG superfamily endonuclease